MIGLRLFTENDMHKHTDCCPVDSSTGVDRRTVLKTALSVAAVGLAGSMGALNRLTRRRYRSLSETS
jgi:hypothetical protein